MELTKIPESLGQAGGAEKARFSGSEVSPVPNNEGQKEKIGLGKRNSLFVDRKSALNDRF